MDAFVPTAPEWTNQAIHAYSVLLSRHSSSREAVAVWLNRRSAVTTVNHRRKW
jgi:O-acetylhomoserine/O-acetylserine sulfhydrylase-like pyridoxal-dependent enzyme